MNTYISIDGNRIGSKVEAYLIANDVEGLVRFSQGVERARQVIETQLRTSGITILFSSGDSVLAATELPFTLKEGEELAQCFEDLCGCVAAVGIAYTLCDVYLAIKLAKASDNVRVIDYRKLA